MTETIFFTISPRRFDLSFPLHPFTFYLSHFHGEAHLPRLERSGKLPSQPGRGSKAGAVAPHQFPDRETPECLHRLVNLFFSAKSEMHPADDGENLRDTGLFPGKIQGVDDPGMAAAEDQDQPLVGPDDQRLVVRVRVGATTGGVAEEPAVTPLEPVSPGDLAGQEDIRQDFPPPVITELNRAPSPSRNSRRYGIPMLSGSPVSFTR